MKSVYIVLLHFKNFYHTDFCLESISHLTYSNYKVIVVDNNSDNDSFVKIKEKYPQHIYFKNNENLGFSRGTNVGIREALRLGADYIYILNNDVEVSPGCLQPMLEIFDQNADIGLVTNKIMFRGNKQMIWQAGGYIDHKKVMGIQLGFREIDTGQYDKETTTYWASGASSLVKRAVFEKIGLLPEEYFFGQEEWDFSTKSIESGFKIMYTHKSVVYHEIAASTKRRPSLNIYSNHRNKLIYAKKFLSFFNYYFFLFKFLVYVLFFFKKTISKQKDTLYFKKASRFAGLLAIYHHIKSTWVDAAHLEEIEQILNSRYKKYNS